MANERDGGNINETNRRSSASMQANDEAPLEGRGPSSGQAAAPDLKDPFGTPGKFWDGKDGGSAGSPVEITERGAGSPGGMAASEAALRAIGASPKASHDQTSLLNVSKGDAGEKVTIPSESNLNSANQRVGG